MKASRLGVLAAAAALMITLPQPAAAASTTFYAKEAVKVRVKASKKAPALRVVPKGGAVRVTMRGGEVRFYDGGRHNACRSRTTIHHSQWYKARYKGATGYIPSSCASPVR